ncbi:adhesin transport system membrane fusion protein [Azospirillum fermentarium]|uniref:HlyD family type I secretion periplasmic adaptor subunit n=1 Tax=Azospirillum fermentarium TaxID=1233114 RepID=UPI002225DC62|nr:HlyD family type I secretion periplasmic adaptor subunit [Azospirillum fermentarium]MCW2249438.1 adhesin transport system membrane fusion protein [Azospirillum fermentarium]
MNLTGWLIRLSRFTARPPAAGTVPVTAGAEDDPSGDDRFLVTAGALVLFAVGWSSVAELNVTSVAPGEVVPLSYVQSVQHLEGGIVREILVAEGDRVTENQPLVELDQTKTGSDAGELRERLSSLAADRARLEAEVEDAPAVTYPAWLLERGPEVVAASRLLFQARRDRLASDIRIQTQTVTQREQDVAMMESRIAGTQAGLRIVQEQIAISDTLLKREITNRMKHLELLRDQANLTGTLAEDRNALLRAQAALGEARDRLAWITQKYKEEVRSALEEARRSIAELSQRQARVEDNLDRSSLRAPVAGVVKTLSVSTRGAVVKPGDTVVELVPADSQLVIDARLPVQDIGYVQTGQEVSVTLASSDASRFGHIVGHVRTISPDTLVDADKQSYYKVRIALDSRSFQYGGRRYDLYPGVRVVCSILTGQRTVLDYVLSPILSGLHRGLQER